MISEPDLAETIHSLEINIYVRITFFIIKKKVPLHYFAITMC